MTTTDRDTEASVIFINQPAASLIVSGAKTYVVSPHHILGTHLVVTGFDILSEHRKIADNEKVRRQLLFDSMTGWEGIPRKSIIGCVNITKCSTLTAKDVEYYKNKNTFDSLVDSFYEGDFLCEISEAKKFGPVPTTMRDIISKFKTLNIDCDAVKAI